MSKFTLLAEKAMLMKKILCYPDAIINIRHKARIDEIESILTNGGV